VGYSKHYKSHQANWNSSIGRFIRARSAAEVCHGCLNSPKSKKNLAMKLEDAMFAIDELTGKTPSLCNQRLKYSILLKSGFKTDQLVSKFQQL